MSKKTMLVLGVLALAYLLLSRRAGAGMPYGAYLDGLFRPDTTTPNPTHR